MQQGFSWLGCCAGGGGFAVVFIFGFFRYWREGG